MCTVCARSKSMGAGGYSLAKIMHWISEEDGDIFVEVLPCSSIPFTFTKTEWSLSPELSLVAFLQ